VKQLGLTLETSVFSTGEQSQPVPRSGDLIRLMGLQNMPAWLRPADDLEAPAETRLLQAAQPASLLGDATVPVALVGTSYSLRGNFHGYLQQALSASVLNAARDGGGFLQAATDYLKDEAFRQSPPALLLWEIPERFVDARLDDEPGWLQRMGLNP
jgi:alginate O-acetyltransferase complex protein AlgJ